MKASDYRGFLHVIYKSNKELNSQFSFAYIAKQCEFSSKSFFKDVIEGKKHLSIQSANKIISGLSLPQTWGAYFLNLYLSEQNQNQKDQANTLKELKRLKEKILTRKTSASEPVQNHYFFYKEWPYIYAALGDSIKGATPAEIIRRTGLDSKIVDKVLAYLVTENLVSQESERFVAKSNSAFFENLGKSDFFKNYYLKSILTLHQKAQKDFSSNSSLFYSISVSVNSSKMPQFKKELAELFDKYTSQIESPEGDKIAELTCGFHVVG